MKLLSQQWTEGWFVLCKQHAHVQGARMNANQPKLDIDWSRGAAPGVEPVLHVSVVAQLCVSLIVLMI